MSTMLSRISLREKILVVALLWLGAGIWLSNVGARARVSWQEWSGVQAEKQEQQVWLDHRATIEQKTAEAARRLEPSRTFSATSMVSELNQIATKAGLTPEVASQRTERTPQFVLHTARSTFRRVPMSSLIKFYIEFSRRAPYLTLDQMSLTVDRSTGSVGTTVNATFLVVAVELNR